MAEQKKERSDRYLFHCMLLRDLEENGPYGPMGAKGYLEPVTSTFDEGWTLEFQQKYPKLAKLIWSCNEMNRDNWEAIIESEGKGVLDAKGKVKFMTSVEDEPDQVFHAQGIQGWRARPNIKWMKDQYPTVSTYRYDNYPNKYPKEDNTMRPKKELKAAMDEMYTYIFTRKEQAISW